MKLSVLIITYNHERYIRQALDGVLMQQVDFDYEIVVGEDRSTDATRSILLEYGQRHPDKFRLLLRDTNMGAIPNFYATLGECRGQYVALVEGDDYWTDPTKLRKQVEFLDKNPDYAACFHNVTAHFEGAADRPDFNYVRADQKETITLADLLDENVIPTCSTLLRRGLVDPLPAWVYELKMADYPLHVLNAQHGKIGYISEIMGVYRIHSGGVWTGLDWVARQQMNIKFFEFLCESLQPPHRRSARVALARAYWQLAGEYEVRGDRRAARQFVLRSLRVRPLTGRPSLQHKLRVLARVSAPMTYGTVRRLYGSMRRRDDPRPFAPRQAADVPRISVIIPAFNVQRFVGEAVESTLRQTYEDFECIVVDDGSNDRTPNILDALARRDPRVRPLRIPHGGIVEALNAGLHAARGELVARMDADDIAYPDRFTMQVKYLDEHPKCVAVGSRVMLMDPYGSLLWEIDVKTEHEQIEADLLRGNGWALFHPTAMIRKAAMVDVGGYRPEYQWSEDLDLFLRLAEVGRLANLPRALLQYRQHFSSVNRTKMDLQLRRSLRLLEEAYGRRGRALPAGFRPDLSPPLPPYDQISAWGRRAIINRNFRVARRHALTALRLAPFKYDAWSLAYHSFGGR